MRKIFSLLCLMLITLTMSAQDNPNRLIIQPKQGTIKGFLVDRIDSIYFANLEGRVAADVQFLKYSPSDKGDTLYVAVTKTAECSYYKINVMPTTRANALTRCRSGELLQSDRDAHVIRRLHQCGYDRI